MPKVYVGVVFYNSRADLPDCFECLRAQTFVNLEIVAVDNASQDGSVAWVEANVPRLRLLKNSANVGFACAHNQIIAACDFQADNYYLPLNPDVQLRPDYIERLIEMMTQSGAGWAIGKLLLSNTPERIYSAGHALRRDGYAFNIGYGLLDEARFNLSREVFGTPGAASLISIGLIKAVAADGELFDRHMFLYGEDTDLDWRARRAGWHCWYVPDAVATHRGSQPNEVLRIQAIGNRYLSMIKNAFLVDLFLYNMPLMALHCAARLILTPRRGHQLIRQIMRFAPVMWRKRRPAQVSRATMLNWFRWSDAQPTTQPITFRARLKAQRHHVQN